MKVEGSSVVLTTRTGAETIQYLACEAVRERRIRGFSRIVASRALRSLEFHPKTASDAAGDILPEPHVVEGRRLSGLRSAVAAALEDPACRGNERSTGQEFIIAADQARHNADGQADPMSVMPALE
jgi:hypothetical protein